MYWRRRPDNPRRVITLRTAQEADFPAIALVLEELELGHPAIRLELFHLGLSGGEIVAVANVMDCGPSLYMSAVGVRKSSQGGGVARSFLGRLLSGLPKEVYVYTRIPEFFGRFGFEESAAPGEIPPRSIYDCASCGGLNECLCMVRRPYAAVIS